MRAMGVTCAEIKTGYGLDARTELKQISVIDQLKKTQKMHIVGTFMGLHAVPRGMNADEYTDECIRESLPAAAGTGVCEFADAFVERGAFSAEQAKRYFLKAKQLGFSLKVHADEMTPSGGTRLGVELGAKSADHLLKILDEDIALLAKSQTVATVLPLTAFCLRNAMLPIVTQFGMNISGLIGGSVVIEKIFNWNGMGTLFLTANGNNDYPLMMGIMIFMSAFALVANLLTDFVYSLLDPRVTLGERR